MRRSSIWRRSLWLLYDGGLPALYDGAPLVLYGENLIESTRWRAKEGACDRRYRERGSTPFFCPPLKKLQKFSLFSRKSYILLITHHFAETWIFQTIINQCVTKYVIIAIYFVVENIRKKNRNEAQKGLNRWKIGGFRIKKVAYIYCNPKKMLTFAGLLAQWNRDLGRQTPVIINKLKV